jgi:hypothetical protein
LGILSSKLHTQWSLRSASWIGIGNDPRYINSRTFDPFPFPDPDEKLKAEIADIAEKLDAHRKSVQATQPDITLTEMYNVLEKLRADAVLTDKDEDIRTRALVLVLRDYHDQLDDAVFRAYGWPRDLSDERILERLVALNKERAAEEATGKVRWLRPDYQIPRFGSAAQKAERKELDLVAPEEKGKPGFPTDELRRTSAIYTVLASATAPLSAADIAARFRKGKTVEREISLTLKAYVRFGDLITDDGGKTFRLPRAA